MEIVFFLAVLIMSVVVHEVSHGYVADSLGDPTARMQGRLTLNPINHLDPIGSVLVPLLTAVLSLGIGGPPFIFGWAKPVPYNPYNLGFGKWGPALVAAAGPLANIFIAIFFGIGLRVLLFFDLIQTVPVVSSAVQGIVFINVLLAVFNLLPIPPLDGSKVLFALLPHRFVGVQHFFERYYLFIILFLFLFGWEIFVAPLVYFFFDLIS